MAFHDTLLCSRGQLGSRAKVRANTMSSTLPRSSFFKDNRKPTAKVDYVKEEPTPFCIETKLDETTIVYFEDRRRSLQDDCSELT